jgi:hypothetical protein
LTFNEIYSTLPNLEGHKKYRDIPNTCVLSCEEVYELDLSDHTRKAIKVLPVTEKIIVTFMYEALHSIHWNVVFNLLLDAGYKKILFIDGGEFSPILLGKLENALIYHRTDRTAFFAGMFQGGKWPALIPERERTKVFVSLARMVREERVYFTNKILNDTELYNKGIVSCGWGTYTYPFGDCKIQPKHISLPAEELDRFPVTLGHQLEDQHIYFDEFSNAMFNVVLESSIGMNLSRYYNGLFTNTDRLFITEKTTKAFYMHQIPIVLGAPGIVRQLRKLGYDMFDDIVHHDYDDEDNVFKRCDMIFDELKRLSSIPLAQFNTMLLTTPLANRLQRNKSLLTTHGKDEEMYQWARQ